MDEAMVMPMPEPKRGNRQRVRTRSALLNAGQQLFATRAVEGVTIDDIVGIADVAKGSFYNHFEDKNALADAVFELVQGDVEFHIFAANSDVDDPSMRVSRALCTVVRYAGEHPDRLQALLSLAERRTDARSPLNVGLSADLRHGLEQGQFAGLDVSIGILTVIGIISVAVRHAMSPLRQIPVETLAAEMAGAALRALGAAPAAARHCGVEAAASIIGARG